MALTWKMGFEIELMAPQGATRADLAARVARRHGGSVRCFFHPQSEPSIVPGLPVFENLTQGFEALDGEGNAIASFVDDLTLQAGLDKRAAPRPGWCRVVADDARLLRLVMRHCDAGAPLATMLEPFASLFGTVPQIQPTGMVRIVDDRGASIVIGAPLPGERERPCEIVTAPLSKNHARVLTALLADARADGFGVPREGATHIHFDAAPLLSARVIAVLVETLSTHGDGLKRLVGSNAHCVRLGPWPRTLPALTRTAAFQALPWPQARASLRALGLTKYCDFNLLNIAAENATKHTFELRILPVWLDAAPLLDAAALFEALLRWCCDPARAGNPSPAALRDLIAALPLPPAALRPWIAKAAACGAPL